MHIIAKASVGTFMELLHSYYYWSTPQLTYKRAIKTPNLKQVQRTQQIFLTILLYTQPVLQRMEDKNDVNAA